MTRNENDLRDALGELERRADQHGAPSTATILSAADAVGPDRQRGIASPRSLPRSLPRWAPPAAAAAAAAVIAVTVGVVHTGSTGHPSAPAGNRRTAVPAPAVSGATSATPPAASASPSASASASASAPSSTSSSAPPSAKAPAAVILDDAAARLNAAPGWTTPAAQDFFYVRTNQAITWTSVSGRQAGAGRTADGTKIWVSGCKDGRIVSSGESGSCTLADVPHYLGDAPTAPSAWAAYLEHIAPGAKAADAQGKIIEEVLHQDLVAPKAAAALLRYTATRCPGLHTLTVRPVAGEQLIGVTCASMTNGSYGLVFDAASHAFVGFVGVAGSGRQDGQAEIVRATGIVAAIGRTP